MRRIISAISMTAASIILLVCSRNLPGMADWYGTYIYPFWTNTLGRIWGLFPFSAVEVMLYILALLVVFWFGKLLFLLTVRNREWKKRLRNGAQNAAFVTGLLLFIYTLTCGINYGRETFAQIYEMEERGYTTEELQKACEILREKVNQTVQELSRTDSGELIFPENEKQLAVSAMENLGRSYPELSGYYPLPKPLAGSWLLSVQSLTGVYSPFTVEANYNNDTTAYNKPFTMCHELSHLKGFMQEDEANFIAFLACVESDSAVFHYSGALLGWIYCSNELYARDPDAYRETEAALDESARRDLSRNTEFWNRYEGMISKASEKVNDTYLKANGQTQGVRTYDKAADLIVQYLLK